MTEKTNKEAKKCENLSNDSPNLTGNIPWNRLDDRQLVAFIPGTIIDVKVKVGQKVKQGDILVILDAMKMHNRILAPMDSAVKEIAVKPGDRVCKGFVMVVLE